MATITRARISEMEFVEANKIDEQKQPFTDKRNRIENRNMYRRRVTWRPPIGDRLKANVDGAFRKESRKGAIAVVIRDNEGKVVAGSAEIVRATSSLSVESMTLRSALILAKNLQLENILFESDSLPFIQVVKAKETIGEIDPILRDIYVLMEGISNSGFTWTHREGNQLAHQVASLAINGRLNQNWTWDQPLEIRGIARREAHNTFKQAMTEQQHFQHNFQALQIMRRQ
ncbi:hypothetical protein Ahy_B07g086653 [Arachis hypogaea]|uniref:RNase H type-1 domain-containing protein n=1 Tax=Arachis hypogaea TaxID=3818 RepID=A0A444YA83_ARAHY|nr:uncharacterized protein LOC112763132 [Arachis hypogaea]RYQ98833.1 hypothetical protein Ahy_B07g086653 [Arachis hypogaea]